MFVAMLYLVSWLNVEWTTLLGWLIFFFSLAVALLVVVIRVHRIARRSIQRLRSNEYLDDLIKRRFIRDKDRLDEILDQIKNADNPHSK